MAEDKIRARLDLFHTCQGDEHAEMWRAALRAVLDLCDGAATDPLASGLVFTPVTIRRVIAEHLGVTDV